MEGSVSIRSDPQNLRPPLEVVHFDRSDRNFPFHFDKLVAVYLSSVASHRCGALGKGMQNRKVRSARLARFYWKMSFNYFYNSRSRWSDRLDMRPGTARLPDT